MSRKILLSTLLVSLMILGIAPMAFAHNYAVKNPGTLIFDTIGEPETVDPAWAYDTASGEVIQQVYETLIFFHNNWTDGPYASGKTDKFDPVLATSVPSAYRTTGPDITGPVKAALDFTIRPGHHYSDPAYGDVTAEDVEYSIERMLVQDRIGGPQWMFYYPLLGVYGASSPAGDPDFGTKIDQSVVSAGNTVTFYFDNPLSLTTMLQIFSQTWGSVVSKAWATSLGDFDGNWAAGWEIIYADWHDPAGSFIGDNMMGSGPYKFNFWQHGVSYSIKKNPNYWQGFPATVNPGSTQRIAGTAAAGSVDTIIWNYFLTWTTRRPRFLNGDSDLTSVGSYYRDQVLRHMATPPSDPKYYVLPFYPLSVLSCTAWFYTFDITTTSPYASWNAPGVFTETGLPPNIFSDVNVRKGFAYAFDYNSWLAAAYLGEGSQPSDPIIQGLLYDNPAEEKYCFDLNKAKAALQAAWGGALWANGMTFKITYHFGNVARQTAVEMIANNINSLNPKFHLIPVISHWELPQMVAGELPIFIIGWPADYPDPDNFAFPFMHSQGTFAAYQKYSNATVDYLIETGATYTSEEDPYNGELDVSNPFTVFDTWAGQIPPQPYTTVPDSRWPRRSIYYALQRIYYEDVPGVVLVQPLSRHFERDWVRGWYYNSIYPGNDYYHIWKSQTHLGDATNDGKVNLLDSAYISGHWFIEYIRGPEFYNPSGDINGGQGGLTGSEYERGMSDGAIDILDLGLVSAFFDGPPQGPAHP